MANSENKYLDKIHTIIYMFVVIFLFEDKDAKLLILRPSPLEEEWSDNIVTK
jgi:hypothetical protein